MNKIIITLQWNLSIPDTLGPQKTVLIIEVSLFHRFIYTHLYCNGSTTDCPYYRGVLIIEVSLFQSVHNSRFDCTCIIIRCPPLNRSFACILTPLLGQFPAQWVSLQAVNRGKETKLTI